MLMVINLLALTLALTGAMLMRLFFGSMELRKPRVLQVMYLTHILAQFIPAMVIANTEPSAVADTFLFHCAVAALLIPVGGLLLDLVLGGNRQTTFYELPLSQNPMTKKHYKVFFVFYLIFCLCIFFAYLMQSPPFAIYDLIRGNQDFLGVQEARREASSLGLLFGMALRFYMPLLFLLGMMSIKYVPTPILKKAAILAISVAFLYNAWPGSKTPVATLFFMAMTVFLIRSRESSGLPQIDVRGTQLFHKRKKVALGVGLCLTFIIGYPVFVFIHLPAGEQGFGYVLESVFSRIFFKPAENSFAAFELFSERNYTYFSDISKVASLLGVEYYNLSANVAIYRGLGDFTNAPPAAIGNFYAQGGSLVVILGVLLASFIFRLSERIIWSIKEKTPLVVAIYAIVIFSAFRFSWANFHTLLMSEVFVPLLSVWVFWILSKSGLNNAHKHSLYAKQSK